MSDVILETAPQAPRVRLLREAEVAEALAAAGAQAQGLAAAQDFKGKAGQVLLVPDETGAHAQALFGLGEGRAAGVRA
ncbi:MAG: leucyl aminopeptidase family protein, partial [Caulobacteraceae bacterium]|nr:leucyl aminopeptidase family protein [Caulobacteraceae bacterium]